MIECIQKNQTALQKIEPNFLFVSHDDKPVIEMVPHKRDNGVEFDYIGGVL